VCCGEVGRRPLRDTTGVKSTDTSGIAIVAIVPCELQPRLMLCIGVVEVLVQERNTGVVFQCTNISVHLGHLGGRRVADEHRHTE